MRDCVISAAGASIRMGAWKPTLPFGGTTIIGATVSAARGAGLRVFLVVGYRGAELAALFRNDRLVVAVENPDWEAGLPGSMLRGAEAAETDELFLMNGDKPLVGPDAYRALAEEADRRAAAGFPFAPLFASYRGAWGHPVLVRRDQALALSAERERPARMRDFLARFGPEAVECGDPGTVFDIDTRSDYEKALSRLHS